MSNDLPTRFEPAQRFGALAQCVLFSLAMAAVYAVVAAGAALGHAPNPWLVAALAAGLCWLTGIAALCISAVLRGPEMALYSMLFGQMIRMFLPLGVCLIIYARGGALVDAGLIYYVLIFYLTGLAIETGFLVRQLQTAAVER